jgi:hypothetical protein
MNQKIRIVLFAAATTCFVATLKVAVAGETEFEATPYRPTVSNPADLPVPGWLEMEFGVQRVKGGDSQWRDSYPVLAKLAFSEDWGVLLGSELAVRRTDLSDNVFSGNGDTVLMLKHRIPTASAGAAWGIEAGYKAPTASDTIGSGQADYIVNGIYSTELSGHHVDLNLGATKVGGITDGSSEYQYNWAISVSHTLGDKLGAFVELSGIDRQGALAQKQLMAGVSYNFSKRIVFDVGATSGLASGSPDWSAFAGVTTLLGKLW